jgi:hypothetical protein
MGWVSYLEHARERKKRANKPPKHEHKNLTILAEEWLKKTFNCKVVLKDFAASISEIPDAIGWKEGHSIVIECKTSKPEFVSDKKKKCRTGGGMGNWRFFLTPDDVDESDILEGWGVYKVVEDGIIHLCGREYGVGGIPFPDANQTNEIIMLTHAVSKMKRKAKKFGILGLIK